MSRKGDLVEKFKQSPRKLDSEPEANDPKPQNDSGTPFASSSIPPLAKNAFQKRNPIVFYLNVVIAQLSLH
jgi:hypothetical protein